MKEKETNGEDEEENDFFFQLDTSKSEAARKASLVSGNLPLASANIIRYV